MTRLAILLVPIFLLALIPIGLAEQTVKTIDVHIGSFPIAENDVNYYKEFTFSPPDGLSSIISAEVSLIADVQSNSDLFVSVNGNICDPESFKVKDSLNNYQYIFDCSSVVDNTGSYNISFKASKDMENVYLRYKTTYYNSPDAEANIFGTEYQIGENGTVFLQLLTDDRLPVNNAFCFMDLYYPNKTILLDNVTMMYLLGSDGLYYYDIVIPDTTGVYMLSAFCNYYYNLSYETPTQDAFVYSAMPTSNYGTSSSIIVGNISTNSFVSYVEFNTSTAFPDANDVTLFIRKYFNNGVGNGLNLTVQRVTSSWSETNITWNNQPSVDSTVFATATISALGWYELDVTDLANSWTNGTYPNYGFFLNYTSSDGYYYFYSSEYSGDYKPRMAYNYDQVDLLVEVKGSGELHVSDYVKELNDSIAEIPKNVWNYQTRNLTDYNLTDVLNLLNDIRSYQINELSNNLTEILIQLDYINTTANRTWTHINIVGNLTQDVYDLLFNLTIGNVSVSADVNWTEGELVLYNASSQVQGLAEVLRYQAQNIQIVTTTDTCEDPNTLNHHVNTTNCIADNCYTSEFDSKETCLYGCKNNICVPPPWMSIGIGLIIALIIASVVYWVWRRHE